MRTSRLSKDTQRVVNALSPSSGTPIQRRSPRNYAAPGPETTLSSDAPLIKMEFEADSSRVTQSTPPVGLGKRKRQITVTSATSCAVVSAGTAVIRESPPKAPKLKSHSQYAPDRRPRRQPTKHIKRTNGTVTVEPPTDWETVYNVTAQQRKRVLAPVDTMGCESLAEAHRTPRDQRLQILVSLMLSSQTKDTVTAGAMRNLQEKLPGGLCLESLLEVVPVRLNELIGKVGFHNTKTNFIKSVATILRDQYNGDIPDTMEGLVALPGVGPKMAYLCMSAAWGRDEGIGVDVHVHRITNLWGWHKTSTPEQTRAELEAWLPRDKWHGINHLLVGFGQTVCLPVGRRCGECDLAKERLCPSAIANSSVRKRVKKQIEIKVEAAGEPYDYQVGGDQG